MAGFLSIVVGTVLMATLTNGQCTLSLVFSLEPESRMITITKATSQVEVEVRISCTGALPTTDTDTVFTLGTSHGVVTDGASRQVTIRAGQPSTMPTTITVTSMAGMAATDETFTVTLTSSTPSLPLDDAKRVLEFTLKTITEVSFNEPRVYEGEKDDVIEVVLVRTEPTLVAGAVPMLTVVETGTYLDGVPANVMFSGLSATVIVTIVRDDPNEPLVQTNLMIDNFDPNVVLETRVPGADAATINIIGPPVVSVSSPTVTLSPTSTFATFRIQASRAIGIDVNINIGYSGDAILLNPPSMAVLPANSLSVDVNLMIDPPEDNQAHSFVAGILSADAPVNVATTNTETQYTLPSSGVVVTIPIRSYTVAEGQTETVQLTSDRAASTDIVIDLVTPLASDADQLGILADAVIQAGQTSTGIGITVLADGIAEAEMTVTVRFSVLEGDAQLDPTANVVTVTIPANGGSSGSDGGTGGGTGGGTTGGSEPTVNPGTSGDGLSSGAIAGIVIGAVGVLFFFIMIAVVCGCMAMSGGGGYGGVGYARRTVEQPYPPPYQRPYVARYPPVVYEVDY